MITYNYKLQEAKKRVIELIKSHNSDFRSDMMLEIKKAAENNSIDDVEMFTEMLRVSETISNNQIDAVEKACTVGEILVAVDLDAPGNVLFEQEDLVLSAVLDIKVRMEWGNELV